MNPSQAQSPARMITATSWPSWRGLVSDSNPTNQGVNLACTEHAISRYYVTLRSRGFELQVDGTFLWVSPAERLTKIDRSVIRANKPALIALASGSVNEIGVDPLPTRCRYPAICSVLG